jgi:hypothetical protein
VSTVHGNNKGEAQHQHQQRPGDATVVTVSHNTSAASSNSSRRRNSPMASDLPMRGANAYVLKDGADALTDLSEDQCDQVRIDELFVA